LPELGISAKLTAPKFLSDPLSGNSLSKRQMSVSGPKSKTLGSSNEELERVFDIKSEKVSKPNRRDDRSKDGEAGLQGVGPVQLLLQTQMPQVIAQLVAAAKKHKRAENFTLRPSLVSEVAGHLQ
jgi:hypothetical protein